MASPSAGGIRRDLTQVSSPTASPGAPVQGGRAACGTMASADEPNGAGRHPDAACSLRSEASHTLQPSEVDVVEAALAEPAPQAVASEEPPKWVMRARSLESSSPLDEESTAAAVK